MNSSLEYRLLKPDGSQFGGAQGCLEIPLGDGWFERIDLRDPSRFTFSISDVAERLCRTPRWANSTEYTVADHLLNCLAVHRSMYQNRELLSIEEIDCCLHVLMHDFAEAYLGDWPRPLRDLCPQAVEIEERLLRQMLSCDITITSASSEAVRLADTLVGRFEGYALFSLRPDPWFTNQEEMAFCRCQFNRRATPKEIAGQYLGLKNMRLSIQGIRPWSII